jgi:streptogramin lyase
MDLRRIILALALATGLLPAATAGAQQLYWLDTRFAAPTLNRANPDGSAPHSLVLPAGSLPEGLAIDPVRNALYWTEAAITGARVRRCGFDFSFPTTVVSGGSALRGIAVDGSGSRMFWTTSNMTTGATVRRSNLDGSNPLTLVSLAGASNPRGIAYNAPLPPALPALFVCDAGGDAIGKYDASGAGGVLFALPAGSRPYGIAVNAALGRVYFTDYRTGLIQAGSTSGGGLVTVMTGLSNPTYIAIDPVASRMFWVEGGPGAQRVMRANLDGTAATNLGLPVTAYGGIAFAPASLITGVDDPPVLELALGAVSPNPALGEARLELALPRESDVRLSIFDVQGREVAVLANGTLESGRHTLAWEAQGASAGVYFARARAEGRTLTRRFTLVR